MDAVACEGSRLIRLTWMLCLERLRWLDVDWAGSGCCGVLYNLDKTNWVYALGTPIWGYGFFYHEKKGNRLFPASNKRRRNEVKTGIKRKKERQGAKKANKLRRVPQQIISSSAITG